ncbi:MAG: hypothetical protein OEW87_10540, partial [Flavobacteriaceae bacterium]|nr:hypothetical protein [Flavobacteriaceae bacterium]
MKSVIGYVAKGKRIRVGEVLKSNGRLLTVIVNNRVAYIQLKDVQSNMKVNALKSAMGRYSDKANRKLEKMTVGLSFGVGQQLTYWEQADQKMSDYYSHYSYALMGYHHNLEADEAYKFSLSWDVIE